MSFDYIRKTYKVPAQMHGRVKYTGGPRPALGTIIGTDNGQLCIMLDGSKFARRYHPTWELQYLDPQAIDEQIDGGK